MASLEPVTNRVTCPVSAGRKTMASVSNLVDAGQGLHPALVAYATGVYFLLGIAHELVSRVLASIFEEERDCGVHVLIANEARVLGVRFGTKLNL